MGGHRHQQPLRQQQMAAVRMGSATPTTTLSEMKAPFHGVAGHLVQHHHHHHLGSIRASGTSLITSHPARLISTHVPHAAAPRQIYTPSINRIGPMQVGIRAGSEAAQIRRMSQAAEAGRHITYTGTWDCFTKTLRYEGVRNKDLKENVIGIYE